MIKLVAFDWNGTLISDTLPTWRASNILFENYGLTPISLLDFQKTFCIPVSNFWAQWTNKNIDFVEQSKKYHKEYYKQSLNFRTRKGAKEVLRFLGQNHITRMIYSNHIAPEIVKELIRLNIFDFFDEVLARPVDDHSHMHFRSKDQKLKEYVDKNNLKPEEVLTIGDTEEEIQIGKKFGFYTVGITGGYNSVARLRHRKPDFLISHLVELVNIIKTLNNV